MYYKRHQTGRNYLFALCVCKCGNISSVSSSNLFNSRPILSCGCLRKEVTSVRNTKHGLSKRGNSHPLYQTWKGIRARCTNQNHSSWKHYGGRGITVCKRWGRFDMFVEDMFSSWKPGLTIERKNNSLGYFPENCCWATRKEQGQNKRNVNPVCFNGKTQSLSAWSVEIGGNCGLVAKRLKNGWDLEEALTTKP